MSITNYWWQLIWIFLWGGLLVAISPKKTMRVMGKQEPRWYFIPALMLALPYILQAAFRRNGFGDTKVYRTTFLSLPEALAEMPAYMETVTKDKGFTVLSFLIKTVIGNSDVLFFLIIAVIQMLLLVRILRKYSCNYWMSFFIFVASTEYMSWFHNGMRQFTAVALAISTLDLVLKKKYIPAIGIILLASTMHISALIMIPIIFIVQGKAWNKKTILCIIASVTVLTFVDQFTDILDASLADTQYSNMVTDWKEWKDDGTNPLRVLVYSLPMLLSLVGSRHIRAANDPVINMMVNFSILTFAIALVSMVTSGIFIGRMIIYGSIFSSSILLPWEIENMFTKRSVRLVRIIAVVCYLGFYYYQMHFGWNMI